MTIYNRHNRNELYFFIKVNMKSVSLLLYLYQFVQQLKLYFCIMNVTISWQLVVKPYYLKRVVRTFFLVNE